MKHQIIIFTLFSFLTGHLIAQPSLIFSGGGGSGYQLVTINKNGIEYLYKGGQGNGYSKVDQKKSANNNFVKGGDGNGYAHSLIVNLLPILFQGGSNNGYALSALSTSNNPFLYKGGKAEGYFISALKSTNDRLIFSGGSGNGYDMFLDYRAFVWTGDVGTGWNVEDNWNYFSIPSINRPVIIPGDASNWPFLNDGIFAIGSNPNQASFTAGEVWIQENAQLYTRVNNFVENYGKLIIDGIMEVRNPNQNSFINTGNGLIYIGNTGQLIFTSQ